MQVVLLLAISGFLIFGADNTMAWEQQKAPEEGINVWKEKGSPFDKVRVEAEIDAPLLQLLALLQDPVEQLNWFPYLEKVEVIQKLSPTQTLVHIQTGSAWLVKARDAITLFTVSQPADDVIDIEMQNKPDAIPQLKGFRRVETSMGHWRLTALPGCKTLTRFEAGSRWGGAIPQWLADKSNVDVAIETIVNLRQWAPEHYSDYQPYSFLQIPALHEKCD